MLTFYLCSNYMLLIYVKMDGWKKNFVYVDGEIQIIFDISFFFWYFELKMFVVNAIYIKQMNRKSYLLITYLLHEAESFLRS